MKTVTLLLSLTIWASTVNLGNGARILAIIGMPSYSHQLFFRPLWREYLRRGHELTLITTHPMPKEDHHSKFRQIDVSMVSDIKMAALQRLFKFRHDRFAELNVLFECLLNLTRHELLHPEVRGLLTDKSYEFDLLLIEDGAIGMYIFKQRFDVPCIAVSSYDVLPWTHEILGNPVHPLVYPSWIIPSDNLPEGVVKRFVTVVFDFLIRKYYQIYFLSQMDRMISETLPGKYASVLELQRRVDMLFTNSNPVFSSVRPYLQTTVSLAGGFHTSRPQNLTKDLRKFLDNSPEGVIYFSLGTNIPSVLLSRNLKHIFLETFRQLPFKVLFKSDLDFVDDQPANVKITKWCPQQAVLRHKNVKVFVTQGGLQSLEETILSGVPVVTIPFFADQEHNAKRVVASGIGVELTYDTITIADFKAAIMEVARNDKYRNKARKHAELILDKPMTPLQQAIWSSEYLLRHKNVKHLKSTSIPAYQYYYLDILAFALVGLCLVMFIFYCMVKIFVALVIRSFDGKKTGIKSKLQ